MMTAIEMIEEWHKGCSCAGPAYDAMMGNKPGTTPPEECHTCTRALIDALERKLREVTPNDRGVGPDAALCGRSHTTDGLAGAAPPAPTFKDEK